MNDLKNMLLFLLLTVAATGFAQQSVSVKTITDKPHPRILLLSGEERRIKQSIADHPVWRKMHEAILQECDRIIPLPPVERVKIGRRLLDKSREALRRIFYLSYAWRMTGEDKYFQRCEKELLAISGFSDWNPPVFLDVAEMTMAAAIGYDWLYPELPDASRKIIREAIVSKGLNPSLDSQYTWWLTAVNNWNQVCNAGMTYGALAVAEDYPELSKNMIDRAIGSIPLPMREYGPDGVYPEGYGYWGYGTSFNVLFLSAVEKVFSFDFGLSKTPGFLQTAGFIQNMTGITGLCFNWSDTGSRAAGTLHPAMFWIAQKNHDPSQLWVEKTCLQNGDYSRFTRDRLLPAIMIWGKDAPLDQVTEPGMKAWKGQGANPVALMRTSWTDPNAVYLGFKAGSPSVNHGHMDIGSFIMEADGVRWASDFGMQDYESLESKGIDVFGRTQDAQRWTIFRMKNAAHNTLTVDGRLQRVKGYAEISKFSDDPGFSYAVSDLSAVYKDQLAGLIRGAGIVDRKYAVVRDELKTGPEPTTVRWTLMTTAAVDITGTNTATLSKDGKQLFLKVSSPAAVRMKIWSTEPVTDYDAPNPGTVLTGFECDLPSDSGATLQVILVPGSVENKEVKFEKALSNW